MFDNIKIIISFILVFYIFLYFCRSVGTILYVMYFKPQHFFLAAECFLGFWIILYDYFMVVSLCNILYIPNWSVENSWIKNLLWLPHDSRILQTQGTVILKSGVGRKNRPGLWGTLPGLAWLATVAGQDIVREADKNILRGGYAK